MEALIYLDTHVAVWLFAGEADRFPSHAGQEIERCELLISPMVVLELQYLFEIGRTKTPGREVVAELGRLLGVRASVLSFEQIALTATSESWTRDPFDRLIVGEARLAGLPLVSKDRDIGRNYEHAIWDGELASGE